MAKKRRRVADGPGDAVVSRALAWLESYPRVSRWAARYDLPRLIDGGGGIVRLDDFLPPFVAEGALRLLQEVPPGRWNDTAAEEDYTHNNIAHRFWSVKAAPPGAPGGDGGDGGPLAALLRIFSLLLPGHYDAFSAARYERDHHIAPHDDRAYTRVRLDGGEVITCSRDVTCVLHLCTGWSEGMGGAFVDLEADPDPAAVPHAAAASDAAGAPYAAGAAGASAGQPGTAAPAAASCRGRVYVPRFNSAIFFRVPRWHAVTPLRTDRPRFSIFGWWLVPGKLYDLYTGDDPEDQQKLAAATAAAAAAAADGPQGEERRGEERGEAAAPASRSCVAAHTAANTRAAEAAAGLDPEEAATRCKLAGRLLAKRRAGPLSGERQR